MGSRAGGGSAGASASWRRAVGAAVVVFLAAACGTPSAPVPSAPAPITSAVVAAITEDGIRADLGMLAAAGAASSAHRALGAAGYDAAVAAVEQVLEAAGWTVTEDAFSAPGFVDDSTSTVEASGRTFGADDVRPLIYAPPGTVEGPVVPVGWSSGQTAPGGQGCFSSDYGVLPAHAIVLVGPDDCYRRQAVIAAQAAGAEAYLAVAPGRGSGAVLRPTLISPAGLEIPALGVSTDVAAVLREAAAAGGTVRVQSHARTGPAAARSIIAELPGTAPDRVVMLGAHLDSVIDGPGANDNGTGVAALLALARALAGTRSPATIRLAFWAAEEEGLVGSTHYIETRAAADLERIVAYLNADMLGSPNGFAGVYAEAAAPLGSAAVRALLLAAVERLGAHGVETDLGGGSDHGPFERAGIPVGGLFSGGADPLTVTQAASAGGTAGLAADACYHLACDTVDNVDLALTRLLAAALADTAVRLAANPSLVVR